MKLARHRKHPDRYVTAIEAGDLSKTNLDLDADGHACFEWSANPPEGVTRADYEGTQARDAALLVKARAKTSEGAGTKLAAEGKDLLK